MTQLVFTMLVVIFLAGFSIVAPAAETTNSSGQFELEKDLVEKMYRSTREDASKQSEQVSNGVSIEPLVSLVSFSSLNLSNRYFTVPYEQDIGSVPLFQLAAEVPVTRFGSFNLDGQLKVGYGYKEGVYRVQDPSGTQLKDSVKLHWIPATVALKLIYDNFAYVTPSLSIGGGIQMLYQSGRLDGSAQTFWVPFVSVSPAVRLFDLSRNESHWFGGVVLGASFGNSVGSTQSVRYWSFDVGTSLKF